MLRGNCSLSQIKNIVENSKKILIVSHYNPDGDAIGSSLALCAFLDKSSKDCSVYNRDGIPSYLNFLSSTSFYTSVDLLPTDFDLLIIVDLNDFERTGSGMSNYIDLNFINTKKPIVVIDHHENNKINEASLYIDTEACSTGVLIFRLIKEFKGLIDSYIATCLLTTIITDTSSFKNSNSNEEAFFISHELIKSGGDLQSINNKIFETGEIKKLALRTKIYSTLRFEKEIKTAICHSTNSFYRETRTSKEDSEGIANSLINYSDVELGIFIREIEPQKWKASLRGNNYYNLSDFANKFGGGGHKNASGFMFDGDLKLLIEKIILELKDEQNTNR